MNRSSFLIAASGSALGLYVSLLGVLYVLQRRLLYFPDNGRPDPSLVGVPGVAVEHVATKDGLSLLAWYAPPNDPSGFVVLYLHGNGGNIAYRAERLRRFARAGWGTLLLEYRGYGGNPGTPTEEGLVQDAQAGLAALHRRGVASEQVLIWGESLGCGVAVRLASEHRVAALLLEAPYTSITALARRQFRFVPVGLLLKDRFDAISRIPAVRAPIFVMAGGRDTLIPPDVSRELFAAARKPKEFWLAPEAGHNDLGAAGAIEAAVAFVRRHLAPNPPTLPTRQ